MGKHRKSWFVATTAAVISLSLSVVTLANTESENTAALEREAVSIVKRFAGKLKPQLKQAITAAGFEHAINVCSVEAPKIAQTLSEETGWEVKRVSLKARNNASATPDPFERDVLNSFDQRQQAGEAPATMKHAEVVANEFRFIKAQGVEGLCLNCHGKSIAPEVQKVLDKHYPDDMATGYLLGQVRGAFSLTKTLE
ncbi:DUF3365 domain-containing protein [Maricurvus nonylphenolicus]|uniref:Tll0287-like domain-containing protein n=1 Tax=Maricurvus nonylphenolicus TaxID=1008307 RepID=UPI0036F1FC3E